MANPNIDAASFAFDSSFISVRDGVEKISELFKQNAGLIQVLGCEGVLSAFFAFRFSQQHASETCPLLVIVETQAQAQAFVKDLQFFLGIHKEEGSDVLLFPEVEVSPWLEAAMDHKHLFKRMSVLFHLSQNSPSILVGSAKAFSQLVIPKAEFTKLIELVISGEEIDRDGLISLLNRSGYLRVPICEDVGTYAVHGGVMDIFVPLDSFPVRLEFFGDLVLSMRFYDPDTQRTLRALDELYIHPVKETILTDPSHVRNRMLEAGDRSMHPSSRTSEMIDQIERGEDFFGIETLTPAYHARMASLFEYLPKRKTIWLHEPQHVMQALSDQEKDAEQAYQQRISEKRLAFPPSDFYLSKDAFESLITSEESSVIEINPLMLKEPAAVASVPIRIASSSHQDITSSLLRVRLQKQEQLLLPLASRLKTQLSHGDKVVMVSPNVAKAERLETLLRSYGLVPRLQRPGVAGLVLAKEAGETLHHFDLLEHKTQGSLEIRVGMLSSGFDLPLDGVSLYCESEIFGEKATRQGSKTKKKQNLADFQDIVVGSLVVHQVHGVGRYQGLVKLPLKGIDIDFVQLKYEGGSLYLPVWRLNELKRYVGAEGASPKLDKLGGESFQKVKSKVSVEVQKLAEELLNVYAKRAALPGISFRLKPEEQQMFAEFESLFPYEETPDQQRAIDEVLADLDESRPMDRLICGDVGYGKTEVALRATMKVLLSGKQVAVLAPTTVLVEQHAARFAERLSSLPLQVRALSRFRSRKEQSEVLKHLADGTIDVVVGTHRLLSADVRFKNLGLLVIDEEQRFGVSHKERLRTLRSQLDTLTLSATPIPRTLHMAFSGLREVSIISTPPEDRLAVRTLVARESDALIKEAVEKELRRGGQVFFVHNRVETIFRWERHLRELLPTVRIGVGHGQLGSEELEKVMLDFIEGKTDLLLCTTIIESGLDIPRANTMLIDRADTFGLSQLYQLRGRIGRSKQRAFCYLMVPPPEKMTRDAKERLAVLQRFTELGSGFAIASHDLEIRGAGELLGDKQSGTISAVGFDMYTQMLKEAVSVLQGQPISKEREPEFTCDLPGFIPDSYIPDPGQRLQFYQRFSTAVDQDDMGRILSEISDRYGPPTEEVILLSEMMTVKNLARRLRAIAIELSESRLAIALAEDTILSPTQVLSLINVPKSLWRLTPDMRLCRNFASDAERNHRLSLSKTLLLDLISKASVDPDGAS